MEQKAQDKLIDRMEIGANKAQVWCVIDDIKKDLQKEIALADDMEHLVLIASQLPEPPLNLGEILLELEHRIQQYMIIMNSFNEVYNNQYLMDNYKNDIEYIDRQHQLLFIRYCGMKNMLCGSKM